MGVRILTAQPNLGQHRGLGTRYYCTDRDMRPAAASVTPLDAIRTIKEEQIVCYCCCVRSRHLCTYVQISVVHGRIGLCFFGCLDGGSGIKLLLFLFRAIVTDGVACRQNKEVSDPNVALCRGHYLQQTLHPVFACA